MQHHDGKGKHIGCILVLHQLHVCLEVLGSKGLHRTGGGEGRERDSEKALYEMNVGTCMILSIFCASPW